MITLEQWLELAKAKEPERFIFYVNTDCLSPFVNEREFGDCEYHLQPDLKGNCIQDIFNNFFDAENWFLTREEAENWLAHKAVLVGDEEEEVWVVTERYEVRKVPMKRVPFHESCYSTKEEAEAKANEYNRCANNLFGAEEELK